MLVSRSRDLVRNNGIAAGAIETLKDNVIGTGLRLSATPDWRWLGRDADWAEEWSTKVESEWRSWAETTACDAAGSLNFHGLTSQVFRGALQNGEALGLVLWLPENSARYATRIQLVEADRLSNPSMKPDDQAHRGGIDMNQYGRPLRYWIRKSHPGDALLGFGVSIPADDWESIPAETEWGRKMVIHVHDKERTGQSRGKPFLASVVSQFQMLGHYQRTELQAAIVNALIAAFIETPLDSERVAELFGGDVNSQQYKDWVAKKNEHTATLRGAAVIPLQPGEKLSTFTPSRPASAFSAFVESVQRHIGVGLNMPYELISRDFSKTNYSSARASLLEAWRYFIGRRQWIGTYWASPVYEAWLEEAIGTGRIEAPGYYENRYAYSRCKWIGAGRGWIDPVKEAEAARIRMESGISTQEIECAEQGLDWEEVYEQRARERSRQMQIEARIKAPLFIAAPPAKTAPAQEQEEPANA
jgi:lambda family phage portal protein